MLTWEGVNTTLDLANWLWLIGAWIQQRSRVSEFDGSQRESAGEEINQIIYKHISITTTKCSLQGMVHIIIDTHRAASHRSPCQTLSFTRDKCCSRKLDKSKGESTCLQLQPTPNQPVIVVSGTWPRGRGGGFN